MSLAMTRTQRETFLASLHIGVLAIPDGASGPLTAPLWYAYEPGGMLWFVTAEGSRKGRLLLPGVRVSLLVQSEHVPYRYASIEGPVASVERIHAPGPVRALARRYLGEQEGDAYAEAAWPRLEREPNVLVTVKPERWRTLDESRVSEASG
jgi:hypothetical protein